MLEQDSRALAGNPMAARVAELEALVAKLEREIDELRAQLEERDDAYLKLLKEYETLKGDVAGNAAMGGGDADKKMIAELMAQVRPSARPPVHPPDAMTYLY